MDKDETVALGETTEEKGSNADLDGAGDLIMAANLNEHEEAQEDGYDGYEEAEEPEGYGETEEPETVQEEEPLPDDDDVPAEKSTAVTTKRRPRLFRPILFVIIVCFCVIAAADIISQQNEIEQLEQETVMMNNKIEETKQKNDEYTALLEADEDEFMERVAVEQLGYSYPNERRYYIVNKSEENKG
ncbi:septum formation initiator [Ruminococcus sp.]|uniref:FtsB family cell division protein n=1 Tax=Ruminococcus sp. TaxID=41978 RepID=UPI0025F0CFBB|nr:septum formation initiator [Ruminococcus sp.]MBQ8966829.1 septum formation initiator family protein [Ruminococcus sp.]